MSESRVLDISLSSIIKVALAGLFFYMLYLIKDLLVWVVFALVISILFNPAIDFLKKYIPRVACVALVYLIVFGVIGAMIYLIAPLFFTEIQQFSRAFPAYFDTISPPLRGLGITAFESFETFTKTMEDNLNQVSSSIFMAVGAIFGGLFSTITILAIAFFLSLEEKGAERMLRVLTPKRYEAVVLNLWERSQKKVSGWFGARILASTFVGAMTFVTCYVLDIDYAISFSLFAGVFNFIPFVGPLLAAAVTGVIVAADSWLKAAFFLAATVLIQQIEGNILSPVLTKKLVGLPPALVLIAVLAGAQLWGLMGALLAIPIAGIFFEFLRDFLKKKKETSTVVL
ncbi:MAG: AI-2E family transporter [Candidatus Nealsonbacteria bacterium]|nr:AI-2E family transporter [Candidatus Nealsonbacteria bacterium]